MLVFLILQGGIPALIILIMYILLEVDMIKISFEEREDDNHRRNVTFSSVSKIDKLFLARKAIREVRSVKRSSSRRIRDIGAILAFCHSSA